MVQNINKSNDLPRLLLTFKDFYDNVTIRLGENHQSPFHILSSEYPEHDWHAWKFDIVPRNFWNDLSNQRKFMDWISKELKIDKLSDWYNVSYKVIPS